MLASLVVHISALLFWIACLIYLPMLIHNTERQQSELENRLLDQESVARIVFTRIASPAALLAICAGTLIFVLNDITHFWLAVKLGLVTMLVLGHLLAGLLVLRLEKGQGRRAIQPWCTLLLVYVCVLTVAIIWLVLAKPDWELNL